MKGLERYIGEVLDGKYRIEKLLGQGGMGAVYFAVHLGTERPVALKIIAPEFMRNEQFIERFKREARAAGRLRHPNVVDVTDFGFAQTGTERVAYLVMEYLDGCTLADVLAEEKRLPLDWVVDILEQVCSAVDEAHQQGIVHRDLKPDNIWLEPNRRGGYTIKVLDFGVAKLDGVRLAPGAPVRAEAASQGNREPGATVAAAQPPALTKAAAARTTNEAATLLDASAAGGDERQTLIFDDPAAAREADDGEQSPAEAQTRLMRAEDREGEAKTLRFEPETGGRAAATVGTDSSNALTQVGSLLGTPLYMSPEQCRGEELNARSDIYSLGVITYQMLAGETPFTGDLRTVMRLHQEAPPPPLRAKSQKKVPKKVAALVERAMSKDPAARPESAAAYANALRANMEGVGSLLRRSFALYSEYFPLFLKISLLAHIPVALMVVLLIFVEVAEARHWLSEGWQRTLDIGINLLAMVIGFLANSVIAGLTVLLVVQLTLAPLRPVQLRLAFARFKKRWRPFLSTSIRVGLRVLVGFILLLVPGIVMMVRYTLYAPVVLLEGLEKKAALKRARELVRRSRLTAVKVVFLQLVIPMVVAGLVANLARFEGEGSKAAAKIWGQLISLLNVLIVPLISIMVAMLYMKLRQVSGEQLRDTLEQMETDEVPRSNWQRRMRLSVHTPAGRH
ncbi:MAG TPA: serine/threonine-protein kinase [Pyrinomonadaceae bacterium]|nr:serine/threonine-protein kinase [Pyrinomonadaceae bacterium]